MVVIGRDRATRRPGTTCVRFTDLLVTLHVLTRRGRVWVVMVCGYRLQGTGSAGETVRREVWPPGYPGRVSPA